MNVQQVSEDHRQEFDCRTRPRPRSSWEWPRGMSALTSRYQGWQDPLGIGVSRRSKSRKLRHSTTLHVTEVEVEGRVGAQDARLVSLRPAMHPIVCGGFPIHHLPLRNHD